MTNYLPHSQSTLTNEALHNLLGLKYLILHSFYFPWIQFSYNDHKDIEIFNKLIYIETFNKNKIKYIKKYRHTIYL
jgi:hypothetical protein